MCHQRSVPLLSTMASTYVCIKMLSLKGLFTYFQVTLNQRPADLSLDNGQDWGRATAKQGVSKNMGLGKRLGDFQQTFLRE